MAETENLAQPGPKTCGNCKFGKPADENHVACFGAPPNVVLVGTRPGRLAGQMEMRFENMRPILANDSQPCSLHQIRLVMDLAGGQRN
jgi:hypothetical protein